MTPAERLTEQTRIRTALLKNGYAPLANVDKACMLTGWPGLHVDTAQIEEWSGQRRYLATGVRVDGRLVVVDFDIDDEGVLDALWTLIPDDLRAVLDKAPMRFGGGDKMAVFLRLKDGESVFGRMVSQAYAPAGEDGTQRVEVFGSGSPRQFGVYGPRSHDDDGAVETEYSWADGQGLCEVGVAGLPCVTVKDLEVVCDAGSRAMREAGWEYEVKTKAGLVDGRPVFDLVEGMAFDTLEHGEGLGLGDLEDVCDGAGAGGVRLSASWLEGPGAVNRSRCIARINAVDGRLQIWESAGCVLHRPADMDVRGKIERLGARLSGRGDGGGGEGGGGLSRWEKLQKQAAAGDTVFSGSVEEGGGDDGDETPDPRPILDVTPGNMPAAVLAAAAALRDCGYVYRMGGRLVAFLDGKLVEMGEARTALEIGAMFRLVERRGKKGTLVDVHAGQSLVRQTLSLTDETPYRELRGVLDMPVIGQGGALVCDGYDSYTQLVVEDVVGAGYLIPDVVGALEAEAALRVLWAPFAQFPFVGPLDRGGALACALTAVARAWLPTAPMFAFDAPAPGSGKSLLCRALGALAGQCEMYAPLPLRNEDEIRKRMMSVLIAAPRAAIFDNQIGMLDSASLAAVLTSQTFADREMGHNTRTLRPATNVLMMVNGNNMLLGGDMPRRVVKVRIDPQMETPFERRFDFDPEREIRARRGEFVAAALTLVRWGMAQAEDGRIGSFERWDQVVGQTVAAAARELDDQFGDPAESIRMAHADDPRRDELGDLVGALREEFGNKWFTGADVAARMAGGGTGNPLVEAFGYDKAPNSKAVGRHLAFRRDAKVSGLCIQVMKDAKSKTNKFRVWGAEDEEGVVVPGELEERRAGMKDKLQALNR